MFNTDLILHLQAWDHPIIYGLMWFISFLSTTPMIIALCLTIAFGLDLKRGLVLINIVAWAAFFVSLTKIGVDYPRPIDLDPNIQQGTEGQANPNLESIMPDGFFELFSADLLEASRSDTIEQYGFPSGQVAIQTSLWLSFLFLFRKRWILRLGVTVILLTSLARIYLGYHFLGDVIGGMVLGLLLTLIILLIIRKSRYLNLSTHDNFSLLFFWTPWLVLPFAGLTPYWQMASVLGLNMAVIFIVQRRNFPVFHKIIWKRVLAAVVVIAFFLGAHYLNKFTHFTNSAVVDFLIITVLNFAVVLGGLSLNRRLFLIKYRLVF